jgi:hypothetical protein
MATSMPDYYPLMAGWVSELDTNTPEARRALFERARAMLIHSGHPPATETEITRERFALEEAIRKVESEWAGDVVLRTGSAGAPSTMPSQGISPGMVVAPEHPLGPSFTDVRETNGAMTQGAVAPGDSRAGRLAMDDREAAHLYKLAADQGNALAQAALTRRGRQQQHKEQERQREATARERQRRQGERDRQPRDEQERQREDAAREQQRRQKEQGRSDAVSGKMSAAQALDILGLKAGATDQEIRAAYKSLMRHVHPDVVGGSNFLAKHLNEIAKQLNEARDVLIGKREL